MLEQTETRCYGPPLSTFLLPVFFSLALLLVYYLRPLVTSFTIAHFRHWAYAFAWMGLQHSEVSYHLYLSVSVLHTCPSVRPLQWQSTVHTRYLSCLTCIQSSISQLPRSFLLPLLYLASNLCSTLVLYFAPSTAPFNRFLPGNNILLSGQQQHFGGASHVESYEETNKYCITSK
jgi:hypothetical protein